MFAGDYGVSITICEFSFRQTHCSTLQHTATNCNTLVSSLKKDSRRLNVAFEGDCSVCINVCELFFNDTLQHTATHCYTLPR